MAVKIRLKRFGKIRAPYYRIVVADSRTKRDGKTIEEIGKYHPKEDPSLIEVNSDRVQYWLGVGAQPSEPVLAILRKTGDWQQFAGEAAPEQGLLTPAPKADKRAKFDEALRAAHGSSGGDAVTKKAAEPKSESKSESKAGSSAGAKKAADTKTADTKTADTTADEASEPTAESAESAAGAEQTEQAEQS